MKSTFWIGLVLGGLLVFGVSISRDFFGTGNKKIKRTTIAFKATGSPKELVFEESKKSKCPAVAGQGNKYGCIDIPPQEQGSMTFKLKTGSWHMKEMIICNGDSKPAQPCTLSAAGQNDFAVKIAGNLTRYGPDQFGVIRFGTGVGEVPGEISEFKFLNMNSTPNAVDYFYILKACENNNPTNCAVTDPLIRNGGTGGAQ